MKPTTMDHDEQLEREAAMARDRLLKTVDELEARKDRVEDEVKDVTETVSRDGRIVPTALGALAGAWMLARVVSGVRTWSRRRKRRLMLRRFAKRLHLR